MEQDSPAGIYYDDGEPAVVETAIDHLARDIDAVTGIRPPIVENPSQVTGTVIIAGTAGRSDLVDECMQGSEVNHDAFESDDESFVIETLERPLPDVESCLLIAGSDRRGTAYGVFELSKQIGVSPWHWWADVPPDSRELISIERGSYRFGPPSVTYRGIFLNDEDWGLRPWASNTFAPEDARDRTGIGPKTYERIFELLLRLKANTIWPAMHPDTKAFYRYEENADLADRYAIVVGTSHCEPMHRNNVDEWSEEMGEWNYATNRERIRDYWRSRVEEVAEYENLFTIGMRGIHDAGMPGGDTTEETVQLLQEVIDDQREMLAEVHDAPAEHVPQVFCPYKEVLDLFRSGLDVPDDVCLMWPDDSHGYLRELPRASERSRDGGSGVYYHLSYYGLPHDYLWLSSVPPGLIRHEMQKAYGAGASECWIVNVGDIKPTEKEMEFFLDLAWDVDGTAGGETETWLEQWAAREFGESVADEVASILSEYYRLCQARKPEHMGWSTVFPATKPDEPEFSFIHEGDEARRRVTAFAEIERRAEQIYDSLAELRRPAFYELVLYPVRCAQLMSKKYLYAARSRLYAGQGRTAANSYAEAALEAHEEIERETEYYNEELLEGKWEEMISANPRDLPVFDEPATAAVYPHEGAALGVVPEGCRHPVQDDGALQYLPPFVRYTEQRRFVDVYTRGTEAVDWTVTASDDWIRVIHPNDDAADEHRVWIEIDWDSAPTGRHTGEITVSGAGEEKRVGIEARAVDEKPTADYIKAAGSVAIEAEDYSRSVDGHGVGWKSDGPPGRISGTTMTVTPPVFESYGGDIHSAPCLEYDIGSLSADELEVEVQCAPTQALNSERDLRYAIAFGDSEPQTVSIDVSGGQYNDRWQRNVLRGAAITSTTHDIENRGNSTLKVWAVDPGLVLDRLIVYTDGSRSSYLGPRSTRVEQSN